MKPTTGSQKKSRKSVGLESVLPGGSLVKNPPANAGDQGLIPGLGRSPGKESATHSRILAQEIPWTEEPGGLQSMVSQKSQTRLGD